MTVLVWTVSLIGGRGQGLVAGWCSRLGAGGAALMAIDVLCTISATCGSLLQNQKLCWYLQPGNGQIGEGE